MTALEIFRETALSMMRVLTPHKSEHLIKHLLPDNVSECAGGYYLSVPNRDGSASNVMWSSHLDVCCSDGDAGKLVEFRFRGDFLLTNGDTILGADCKTGAAMMVAMARTGVPGLYVWHFGEERGGIGAKAISSDERNKDWLKTFKYCIALDRRGYDSVITHQGGDETCSGEFATELAKRLSSYDGLEEYKPDRTGSYTDSKEYCGLISECTNLSVGYFGQHGRSESQDLVFAEALLEALIDPDLLLEPLPAVRTPKTAGWVQQGSGSWGLARRKRSGIVCYDQATGTWKTDDEEDDEHGTHITGVGVQGAHPSPVLGSQSTGTDGSSRVDVQLIKSRTFPHVSSAEMDAWLPLRQRGLMLSEFTERYKGSGCFEVHHSMVDKHRHSFHIETGAKGNWVVATTFTTGLIVYDPYSNKLFLNHRELKYSTELGWLIDLSYFVNTYRERAYGH